MNKNSSFVLNIMSVATIVYAIAMLPAFIVSYKCNESGVSIAMLVIIMCCLTFGVICHRTMDRTLNDINIKYCYLTTILTWLLLIILSALPYYTASRGYSFVDCLFESTASWTTTGASAIASNDLPVGLKVWHASCNWMGGIGIILLALSFLPKRPVEHKLATTEVRGPNFLMSSVTFREAYNKVLLIYLALTVLQFVALRLAGMGPLDSFLTSLSNISTSGLQHINNGVITSLSTSVKVIITIFAFIASINVSVLLFGILGKKDKIYKNSEFNVYILMILISAVLITASFNLNGFSKAAFADFGNSLMQVISCTSTSGYVVAQCDGWNAFSISIIVAISFVGACALSTGGGLKVSRFVFGLKILANNLYSYIHPHSVKAIRYDGQIAKQKYITGTKIYIALFFIAFIIGAMLLSADGTDVYTSLSYSQAMITNVGLPVSELAVSGPVTDFSAFSKIVMSLLMLLGRLEIYPVLMLFSLKLLKKDK